MNALVPTLTREDRRSLFLHRAIADRLIEDPVTAIAHARKNLALMREKNPHARALLDEWQAILSTPVGEIGAVVLDPGLHGRDLWQVTPFAGVQNATALFTCNCTS